MQEQKFTFKNSRFSPAYTLAKQIAERNTRAAQIQQRLEKQSIREDGLLVTAVPFGRHDERFHHDPEFVREHGSQGNRAVPLVRGQCQPLPQSAVQRQQDLLTADKYSIKFTESGDRVIRE